jgi:hypothetical protein
MNVPISREPTWTRPYRAPFLLGASVLGGLLLALMSEGALDFVAIVMVSAPLVAVVLAVFRGFRG